MRIEDSIHSVEFVGRVVGVTPLEADMIYPRGQCHELPFSKLWRVKEFKFVQLNPGEISRHQEKEFSEDTVEICHSTDLGYIFYRWSTRKNTIPEVFVARACLFHPDHLLIPPLEECQNQDEIVREAIKIIKEFKKASSH